MAENQKKGEQTIWEGKPDPKKIFGRNDRILIPVSVLWMAVAMYWVFRMTDSTDASYNILFGFLFIMAGLYLVVLRFYAKVQNKKQGTYKITNKAVYLRQRENEDLVRLPTSTITNAEIIEEKDGIGTVFLEVDGKKPGYLWKLVSNAGLEFLMGEEKVYAMYDIPNAAWVYEKLLEQTVKQKKREGENS